MGRRKKEIKVEEPLPIDPVQEQKNIDLVLQAHDQEYAIGNLNPTKLQIATRTGLTPKQVKTIEADWHFNPKNSPLKFYIPTTVKKLFSIVMDEDTKTADKIKAASVLFQTFNVSEETDMGGNTFTLNVVTAEAKKMKEHVEIRHAEIKTEGDKDE